MSWIDGHWGLSLLCAALIGGMGTILALRLRVRSRLSEIRKRLTLGEIVWGAQCRELGHGRATGTLTLGRDGALRFVPFASDAGRMDATTWPADRMLADLGRRRLDISGLTYRVMTIQGAAPGQERRFGCFHSVGAFARTE